jgi:hypothetical protein
MPRKGIVHLTAICNAIIRTGYFQVQWKTWWNAKGSQLIQTNQLTPNDEQNLRKNYAQEITPDARRELHTSDNILISRISFMTTPSSMRVLCNATILIESWAFLVSALPFYRHGSIVLSSYCRQSRLNRLARNVLRSDAATCLLLPLLLLESHQIVFSAHDGNQILIPEISFVTWNFSSCWRYDVPRKFALCLLQHMTKFGRTRVL